MTVRWRFTEAEFYALWLDQMGGRLPEPFLFMSESRTSDDFDAELRTAREGLRRKVDGDFDTVLDAMRDPDLYLIVYGWNERNLENVNSMVHVLATRRGAKGYVIAQLPGASHRYRGGYTVVECDPLRLADAVVEAFPEAERGSRGDFGLAAPEQNLDHDYGRSAIAAVPDTAVSRTKDFFDAPATATGEIQIVQGRSVFGPRGITRHRVRFRDLDDDGRYVITESPEQALAVDKSRFVSVINSYVAAVVRVIKDERG